MATKPKGFPLLKNSLNADSVKEIATCLSEINPGFDHAGFCTAAHQGLERLELKGRVYHLIGALHRYLPEDFESAAAILKAVKQHQLESSNPRVRAFTAWPLIDYVAVHGLEHPQTALNTLAQLTSLFSAEFAIRPFIQHHQKLVFQYLNDWCQSDDYHLRRLVSEGTRPRLPWGQQLPEFIDDPAPILPLLEQLNADPENYVQRSVANNLNDISKDHPQTVIKTCERWLTCPCPETQWIIKHATRTLIKKGVPEAFTLLGFTQSPQLRVTLKLNKHQLAVGEKLGILIQLNSKVTEPQKLVIDYAIHFLKKNGQQSAKVFKLKNLTLQGHEQRLIEKTLHFAPLTTRRYYPGEHRVEIKINGGSLVTESFTLTTE